MLSARLSARKPEVYVGTFIIVECPNQNQYETRNYLYDIFYDNDYVDEFLVITEYHGFEGKVLLLENSIRKSPAEREDGFVKFAESREVMFEDFKEAYKDILSIFDDANIRYELECGGVAYIHH
jgi:hypothetical protein